MNKCIAGSWVLWLMMCLAATAAETRPRLTEDGGRPVGDNQNSRTAGPQGGVMLDNFHLIQKLSRFDRERIPERVVHARGVGIHGEFVSYEDLSALTKAKVFSQAGKTTPVFVRFSTVVHPNGSPEQLRDPRGFAVKFYTEEGNWDLVGNNLPVFFIRDALKFPDMVHAFKPSPITNQQEPARIMDFLSHVPESTHMLTFLYSNQGTPSNLRQMDGFGVHAFKLVNADGKVTYVKFNWRSLQGLKPATQEEANLSAMANHSAYTKDLYDHVASGEFPQWELCLQTMTPEQLNQFDFDPLDATKTWNGIPETKIGKMTLNRIPANFFQQTEQSAFSPGMVVPGIEPSEDRLLQGRLFSYADTQRYRVGANYLDLPINRPVVAVKNFNQDGALNFGQSTADVNFQPSVTAESPQEDSSYKHPADPLSGHVQQERIAKTLNFKQAGELYRSFDPEQQKHLVKNFAADLGRVTHRQVKLRILSFLLQSDADYGQRVTQAVDEDLQLVEQMVQANEGVDPLHWKQIDLKEIDDPARVTLMNRSAIPVRYQVKSPGSPWSVTYTLLPQQSHSFPQDSVEVRRVDSNQPAFSVPVGRVFDVSSIMPPVVSQVR